MRARLSASSCLFAGLLLAFAGPSLTAQAVPTPESHFGFVIGADRSMANWDEMTGYYERLAATSDRVALDTIGPTEDDNPFVMLTITSPENHARLDELHDIQMRLADPRRIADESEAERLIETGKTVVLITHGIHATEVGSSQGAALLAYQMASSNEPRVQEILDNVIFLQIPSLNPDGVQWIANWYNQFKGTEYEAAPMPWLYQKYVGHDNNRDWFTYAQRETQHTVTGAHNAWHPQIVHDVHQMGGSGARIFFPPYIDPIEENVDPGLVSAVNQLGSYKAADLTSRGKQGVVINAIYDGFHPGRAYMHYHGGARILSETASARLASPIDVTKEQVRGGREYEASERSWKFPWPWEGGRWGLPEITDYQVSGAMALLTNAAKNREYWLRNYYQVNRRAVEKWDAWPEAWVIPAEQDSRPGLAYMLRSLTMGDVEVRRATRSFEAGGVTYEAGTYVVPMRQPWAAFAQTLLDLQHYPDLREYPGGPPKRPYDVTGHTLPLLMGVEATAITETLDVPLSDPIPTVDWEWELPDALAGDNAPRIALYKGHQEPMIAGWTRWVFDQHALQYDTLHNEDITAGDLNDRYDVIVFQSQSPSSILNGYPEGVLPAEYTGGIGESGSEALREFVEAGGRVVAIEQSTDLMIDMFGLPITNPVEGVPPQDFYIPGSILRLDMEGPAEDNIAWYWRSSRAFELSASDQIQVHARYGDGDPLLSGWVLGGDRIAGKPALVSARVGRGDVVLFAFQPNYRSQTVATWPLLWRALTPNRNGPVFD